MRQLLVISGKGGTGKTSVTAAFAHLARRTSPPISTVLTDADVDAANLDLLLQPLRQAQHPFMGGSIAHIDPENCEGCGRCEEVCRFEAIASYPAYRVDPLACEGCAACFYECPSQAIQMVAQQAGMWFRSLCQAGPLYHAALFPAQENSGKLVALVRQQARDHAQQSGAQVVLIDGPPGIGCPVIAASTGVDLALIVTEPSQAGFHDMVRVLHTTAHFQVPAAVCVNKWDIHPGETKRIEEYCRQENIPLIGRIPFDPTIARAMVLGRPVTELAPAAPASQAIQRIWERLVGMLDLAPSRDEGR
jgi:MinD superfamily P-loop ATPase